MKALILLAVTLVALVLLIQLTPATGYRSCFVLIPAQEVPVYGGDELAQFAAAHDWIADFARHRLALEPRVRADLLRPLRELTGTTTPTSFTCQLEYQVLGVDQLPAVNAAAGYIVERMTLEAELESYAAIAAPERRRQLAWRAFARGFDARFRRFLEDRRAAEPEPELRAWLRQLGSRLDAADTDPSTPRKQDR